MLLHHRKEEILWLTLFFLVPQDFIAAIRMSESGLATKVSRFRLILPPAPGSECRTQCARTRSESSTRRATVWRASAPAAGLACSPARAESLVLVPRHRPRRARCTDRRVSLRDPRAGNPCVRLERRTLARWSGVR